MTARQPSEQMPPVPPVDAWVLDVQQVAQAVASDPGRGLTAAEAEARLGQFGPNELVEKRAQSIWLLLLGQFTDAMIIVLIAAAFITAVIGDLKDTVVILAIVALNGAIGFVQEYRAEQALAALRRMASPTAKVVRDGETMVVPAAELVPGDLVCLEAGDVVTADLRLVEARALRISEATLTGESEPVEKITAPLPNVTPTLLADQLNLAFSGTAVTYGRGRGLAVATGMQTALGRVAELLQGPGGGPTPLQRRLASLGRRLAGAAIVVCGVVFAAGIARGEPTDQMFLTAVSLAVAAIPEGLPAVVTVALALGARRLAHRHALIRRLSAVETLGSVTVICSDKTGTLTENRMLVERIWTPRGQYAASGDGYAPIGSIEPLLAEVVPERPTVSLADGRPLGTAPAAVTDGRGPVDDPDLVQLLSVAVGCNDATLIPPIDGRGPWSLTGDPTEAALLALAGKRGILRETLSAAYPRVAELTFDSQRRRMTTLHRDGPRVWVAAKGAIEALVPLLAPGQAPAVAAALVAAERYSAEGYRVLAFAERTIGGVPDELGTVEAGMKLLGLAAMTDPPRASSARAIAACRAAGITPVMITGDHPLTAQAIARRLGILGGQGDRRILTGVELETLDQPSFAAAVAGVAVYARTSPEQKLRIVDAWSAAGATVAMTGDGVNDAPALKRADIGVAMGITGTDVSKEAADMVLADDEFATIVAAVEEGRRIYDNIRRFVRYLLTTNSAEIWVMFLAPFLGLPMPLLAVQILWVNLITDGLPSLALGVEPVEGGAMRRPPRPRSESIFGGGLWQQALAVGLVMAAVTLGVQWLAIDRGWHWQTMVFTTLAFLQLGNAISVRSERESSLRLGIRTNLPLATAIGLTLVAQLAIVYLPPLQPLFNTQTLNAEELVVVLFASTAAFWAVELDKWRRRRSERP